MIHWYLSVKKSIRAIEKKARDALLEYDEDDEGATASINGYLQADYEQLWERWRDKFPDERLGNLGRHIKFGMDCDYRDIIDIDLPELEKRADSHLLNSSGEKQPAQELGFEHLLHPVIFEHAYQLYRNGHLREAVLNSVTAIFDFIREKTGAKEDGDRLINQVMSLDKPLLVMSEIKTESGKSDQKGFMQIYKGVFQGIRNPKAHSLTNDLTEHKAAQYLIFSSMLARRIEEATVVDS